MDMGQVYYWGQNGVDRDFQEAARWFQLAADQGEAHAQFTLGVMQRHGHGVPSNITRMKELFHLAAEQNHTSVSIL
jgi:TPR repeat protein